MSSSYVIHLRLVKIDLQLSKDLLWILANDSCVVPHFVSVFLKIRDVSMSTIFLAHNGFDSTLSIHGSDVHDNEGRVEYGLRIIQCKPGMRLERHNGLHRRLPAT